VEFGLIWRERAGRRCGETATGLNAVYYRQYPVDGQFERLPDGQEVDEDPDESCDEADDGDEQKPVRARQIDGRGAGHAHDAKHLSTDRQTDNK
jgi:hypothetical protein